jgi:hypothetical protein
LSRGGWFGVSNVEILCKLCSRRKGLLTTSEYYALLEFLETKIPLGRQDILNRIDRSTVFLGKKDQDE